MGFPDEISRGFPQLSGVPRRSQYQVAKMSEPMKQASLVRRPVHEGLVNQQAASRSVLLRLQLAAAEAHLL